MTTKQLEIQEAIILACHPWLSLEEAKQKELWFSCMIKSNYSWIKNIQQVIDTSIDDFTVYTSLYPNWFDSSYIVDIIWLPPEISRVLVALWNYSYYEWWICEDTADWLIRKCDRKLLNENWTSATLRDQSEATQDILYNIICKK